MFSLDKTLIFKGFKMVLGQKGSFYKKKSKTSNKCKKYILKEILVFNCPFSLALLNFKKGQCNDT